MASEPTLIQETYNTDVTAKGHEKHAKYDDFYKGLASAQVKDNEYWGIGIENETYLMSTTFIEVNKKFMLEKHGRERYSVNYWENFKPEPLKAALQKLPPKNLLPQYVNAYMFQKVDLSGQHATLYTKVGGPNPKFGGTTIDAYLRAKSPIIDKMFDTNLIYDGDAFELTTFDFYRADVVKCIKELAHIKHQFLEEVNRALVFPNSIFKGPLIYPPLNYGFAVFMTNPTNLAICNAGTYHINITLPTAVKAGGAIKDPERFKHRHANAVRAIQWIEPLLVALYGTPDILHSYGPDYAGGSLRMALSRYIGLGTYDSYQMEKGKLLNCFDWRGKGTYMSKIHLNSPYIPPRTIGYDVNYNKFQKHGIELRFFDYFPEKYLESVMNLIILVCAYSDTVDIPDPRASRIWVDTVVQCITQGSDRALSHAFVQLLYKTFSMYTCYWWWPFASDYTILAVMTKIGNHLYSTYAKSDIALKLSPGMKPIQLTDYTKKMKIYYRRK